jgi:hypothetical protein
MERIRVLIGMVGLDQHELGAIVVSKLLRDAGMEVVYGGKFNIPPKLVKASIEEDVDVIGLSCHSWEYLYYLPKLLELMRENGLVTPVSRSWVSPPPSGRGLPSRRSWRRSAASRPASRSAWARGATGPVFATRASPRV